MADNTVYICGAGTMGSGIAQVAATAGYPSLLYDLSEEVLQKAKARNEADLQKLVEKQKLTAKEKENILQRISYTSDLQQCSADVIIEAVVEKEEVKVDLFRQLSAINGPDVVFASNTSSLSLTKIAGQLPYSERLIGLHFFNPAPLMKLVEVVNTRYTDGAVTQTVIDLAKRFGKIPVVCKDSPGFIVNRVARPFYIESLRIAEKGKVGIEAIDRLLEAQGFRLGPFKLMDLIGNDVNYAVSCSVYEQLNSPERLKPSHLQKEKVERNELGKKTGKGYYTYNL